MWMVLLCMYSGCHGVGALMRDGYRNLVGSFAMNAPILIYVLAMELYAMKMGLVYAVYVCWFLLTLESDSSNVVQTVMGEGAILQRRKLLRILFVVSFVLTCWLLTLFHVKQNVVAHRVAHYSLNHQGVSFSDGVCPYG